jgi:Phage integrase, N-terminal SAM-like domain
MGPTEISTFLTHLARIGNVSAATQNQALSALLFLGCAARWIEVTYHAWSGKQCRQNVSDEIHQAVTDHVCCEIAAPQIEAGQD